MEALVVLIALGLAILYFYLMSPSVIGAQGEHRVSSTLNRKLNENDYVVIDDLTLPTDHGTTQVDHIVVSRYGIFVIETKNMSGWIFGGKTQARWTQVMRRHKSQFQNPLRQNYHHVKVVQELLGVGRDQVENLVAFVGSAEPKTEMPPNVFWSRRELYHYIAAKKIVRFTNEEVADYALRLRNNALEANKETRRAHVKHIQEKASRKEADVSKCPRCGSKMVERTNRRSRQSFLGCSRYPKCRGTRQTS